MKYTKKVEPNLFWQQQVNGGMRVMNEGYNSTRIQSERYSAINRVSEAADQLHFALYNRGVLMDKSYEHIDNALMMAAASRNLEKTREILGPVWPKIAKRLYKDKDLWSKNNVNMSYATLADFLLNEKV
jgi:hypothetical protein